MHFKKSTFKLPTNITTSNESLKNVIPLIITKQFKLPASDNFSPITFTIFSVFISTEHPVEQLQIYSLSDGGVGITKHVKFTSDPTRYSKLLFLPPIELPRGSLITLTV